MSAAWRISGVPGVQNHRFTESMSLALDAAVEAMSEQGFERPLKLLVDLSALPVRKIIPFSDDDFERFYLHRETLRVIDAEGIHYVCGQRKVTAVFRPEDGEIRIVYVWLIQRVKYDPAEAKWWEVLTTDYHDTIGRESHGT